MRKYITIQGDMWDGIAKRVYGAERYMNTLLNANQAYNHIVIFPAGIQLNCPDMHMPSTAILPPWKRSQA